MSPSRRNCDPLGEQSRRDFLLSAGRAGLVGAAGSLVPGCSRLGAAPAVFIGKAAHYRAELAGLIRDGLREVGVSAAEIRGKRILLKPNLVEPRRDAPQITTHPAVVYGAAAAFADLGASEVVVAEGSGHCRDTWLLLEESGLGPVLRESRLTFVDLNDAAFRLVPNRGDATKLELLALPEAVLDADWVVSVAKMKTHHWAGVTLSLKNLFGALPGTCYGWPKNVLHWQGIHAAVLDVAATVRADLAIIDGIVGMEGDGPIMGTAKAAGALVLGRNLAAVDATAARIMGVEPLSVPYLGAALGPRRVLGEWGIDQRGERLREVRTEFALVPEIPAHRGLR